MNDWQRDFTGAYIQFALLTNLIHDKNYNGAENFVKLFRESLSQQYNIHDSGAVAKLMKIESMLINKQEGAVDDRGKTLEVLAEVGRINSWLADGSNLQRIGVNND